MPDAFETPFDQTARQADPCAWQRVGPLVQGTCLVLVEVAGLAANVLLVVLGMPLFVFLLLAGWDLGALFAQLANLADHYASAKPAARQLFARDLQFAFVLAVGVLALLRLPALIRRLERRLGEGAPPHG